MPENQTVFNLKNEMPAEKLITKGKGKEKSMTLKNTFLSLLTSDPHKGAEKRGLEQQHVPQLS